MIIKIAFGLLMTACHIDMAPAVQPQRVVIQTLPSPSENEFENSVPTVVHTWYVKSSSLTSAQNMGQLYQAIKGYFSRDECGCQKGDPLCDCGFYL